MELPKAASGETIQIVFAVELFSDGKTRVDSELVPNDDAVSALAKTAKAKHKDSLRAVVKADKKVAWERVVHVLDLLRKSGVVKIAFAVSPTLNGEKGIPIEPAPTK
jgi:biopolymer transport protein ExbD